MKNLIVLFVLVVLGASSVFAQTKAGKKNTTQHTAFYTYTCPMHPEVKSSKQGKCSKCGMDLTMSKKEQMKAEVTHTYTCPMHSDVVSNNPGKCPQCSSKLVVDRRGTKHAATVYTCVMHPNVSSAIAGKCPVCGMAMVEKKPKKTKSKI